MFSPSLETKKKFIAWFIKHHPIPKREALWILNYLLNHEILLKKIHFVKQVEKTPRGMKISTLKEPNNSFVFYKNGVSIYNAEQAFHDLRLNWREDCYMELEFSAGYETMVAFEVIEKNPFYQYEKTQLDTVEQNLEKMQKLALKEALLQQIHTALAQSDREAFERLTQQLQQIEKEL